MWRAGPSPGVTPAPDCRIGSNLADSRRVVNSGPAEVGAEVAARGAPLTARLRETHRKGEIPVMSWLRLTTVLALRSLRRPRLAADLLRVAWRFRARGWYRRFPFLPLPAPEYVEWRMHTAYGDHQAIPPAEDLERYARWVRRTS